MTDETDRLFVYGTLKPGYRNHVAIVRFVRSVRPGWIEGRLGVWRRAPGLVTGDGRVLGVLLNVVPEALRITDEIEDYRPGADDSLYVRRRVEVRVEDGPPISAWTYYFGDAGKLADHTKCRIMLDNGGWTYEWAS